ncbi:hypothetical protein LTR56_027252 [Elasticomyces elasticus]|nr:hypothetical protein LTR56_027252 [Elasticomyces elasticus]KAK5738746.1 hypothetical protein LTS12_025489 [Elasticomyces elasticus]
MASRLEEMKASTTTLSEQEQVLQAEMEAILARATHLEKDIMRSLIRQCLDIESLPNAFETSLTKVLSHSDVEARDLQLILWSAIDLLSSTHFIIIDGIDECIEAEQKILFRILKEVAEEVAETSTVPVKLFFSSRNKAFGATGIARWEREVDGIQVYQERLRRLDDNTLRKDMFGHQRVTSGHCL